MKLIENKSVVLFWGYLYPFCSTFFTFFTLFSIFISGATKTRPKLSIKMRIISSKRPISSSKWPILPKWPILNLTDNAMKLIEKLIEKDVELFWGYLYPFCSTFFSFFTLLFSIFNFIFREREKHVSPRRVFLLDQPILLP